MKPYLKEVETIIKALPAVKKDSKWKAENYVGAGKSKLIYLDIKIPDVRKVFTQGFTFYNIKDKDIDLKKTLKIFDYIWKNSLYFEVLLLSSYFVSRLTIEQKVQNKKIIFSWLKKVDNWALSDELSAHISQILEHDNSVLLDFKKWSQSKNTWKRRQSLVGLLFYSRFRKKPLPWLTIKPFVERQITDKDHFVQKGVGWCLREAYNLYPMDVYKFIYANAGKIHRTAWFACNEKLNTQEKLKLKKKRSVDRELWINKKERT